MDRPYQAPVGGINTSDELVDEEALEQVPLTPQQSNENPSPSSNQIRQRSRSYLAFLRGESSSSRSILSSSRQRSAERTNEDYDQENNSYLSNSYLGSGNRSGRKLVLRSASKSPYLSSKASRYGSRDPPSLTRVDSERSRMSLGAESRRAAACATPGSPESLATSSRLFGESVIDEETSRLSESSARRLSSLDALRKSIDTEGAAMAQEDASTGQNHGESQRVSLQRREWLETMDSYVRRARQGAGFMIQRAQQVKQPMSPRSRELMDLDFLQQQHAEKMDAMMQNYILDEKPVYDFCIVLHPQEVYAFWASLLDFRAEYLGNDIKEAMEQHWIDCMEGRNNPDTILEEGESTASSPSDYNNEDVINPTTPKHSIDSPIVLRSGKSTPKQFPPRGVPPRAPMSGRVSTLSGRASSTEGMTPKLTPGTVSTRHLHMQSPSLYSLGESTQVSRFSRQSLFERAVVSTPQSGAPASSDLDDLGLSFQRNLRRKWGHTAHPATTSGSKEAAHPSITGASPTTVARSITRGTSILRQPTHSQQENPPKGEASACGPHEIRLEDIPNQVIPRGIAARTNGMLPFLSALRRGIVLRRHRPGCSAMYVNLYSTDGGDTIQYHWVDHATAMKAFALQRDRYGNKDSSFTHPIPWEQLTTHEPRTGRKGHFKVSDLIVVHPARHRDPRSEEGDHGSTTLRKSKSDYFEERTFSLVLRGRIVGKLAECETRWYKNEGSETLFKYLDFEAATEGEYWLVFRGLLLLHRDAAVGRFAENRAAGIGSNYASYGQRHSDAFDDTLRLHKDEFTEPKTVSFLEKQIVKWRDLPNEYLVGAKKENAVPPPSDYFLGFKSPGTSIWSRLRYAGFNTHRLYSIDPNRVIIKLSCPSYRLMDVAEVLKLKVKCKGKAGGFAPFRQDMIDLFKPMNDPMELGGSGRAMFHGFQFSSADRQTIIDFIIRSRIRDSGAELGEATVKRSSGLDSLGKMIEARVPLHMPGKLAKIFEAWVLFWKTENWTDGRNGKSLTHDPMDLEVKDSLTTVSSDSIDAPLQPGNSSDSQEIPPLFSRFFIGAFHQPLTSIEEYFGEKVAFYFAWLQHTALHLVSLTIAGLVVFLSQIVSGNWDTPLRPYFAIGVMIWTFIVLVNWKKRASYLNYEWGSMNYREQEVTRPQFYGDFVTDEITGEQILHYPKWKRWLKYCISIPVTLLFTFGTLFVILWVHANRDIQLARYLDEKNGGANATFDLDFGISALSQKKPIVELQITRDVLADPVFLFLLVGMPGILGLCLPLLNFVLMRISVLLNTFENHRTVSEYRTHLIIKVFSFRFVSHFAVAYYYSFISIGSETAIENGFLRVAAAVTVYTTVARWWEHVMFLVIPLMIEKIRRNNYSVKLSEELRQIELEEEAISRLLVSGMTEELKKRKLAVVNKRLLLDQAQDDTWIELMKPEHDSFPEYIQAVVQFTFVSCFSVVLPITPLICLINYLISMRLDAYKLCKGRRRPLAEKTGGIGVWEHLLHIVAVISVLTNCWLIGFTSAQFIWIGEKVGQVSLFAIVVCWEHVMLLIKYIMHSTISPLPKNVQDAIKREKHDLDEQRNRSMRKRGRRSQYHRHARPSNEQGHLECNTGDDISAASSAESDYTYGDLPHNSPSLTPMAQHRNPHDVEKGLFNA